MVQFSSIIAAMLFGICMCKLEISTTQGTASQEENFFDTLVSELTRHLSNGAQAGSLGSALAKPTRAILSGVDALLVLLALVCTLGKQPELCANDTPVIDAESEGASAVCDTRGASNSEGCSQRNAMPE